MSEDRLALRLRRLEQQVRAFKDLHVAEVSDLAEKLAAIVRLHADELQLILDEIADIKKELAVPPVPAAPEGDPAANSPKRAKWLAEQERKAHPSRRELLLGREEDEG